MPEDTVSEATTDPAQVAGETPSESTEQVVEPRPSETAGAAQEPEKDAKAALAKLTAEEVEALPEDHPVKKLAKGIADKSTLKLRGEFEARERTTQQRQEQQRQLADAQQAQEQRANAYRQLQALRQRNPEEWQKYMDDPQWAAVWAEGGRTMPSSEEIDRAHSEGANTIYGSFYQRLMSKPEMANLSDEDVAAIDSRQFVGQPDAHAAYLDAITDVLAGKKAAAIVEKERASIEEDARKDEREKLQQKYREAGIGPEEIEGKKPVEGGEDAILKGGATTGEQKADAFEKKHGYRPRNI